PTIRLRYSASVSVRGSSVAFTDSRVSRAFGAFPACPGAGSARVRHGLVARLGAAEARMVRAWPDPAGSTGGQTSAASRPTGSPTDAYARGFPASGRAGASAAPTASGAVAAGARGADPAQRPADPGLGHRHSVGSGCAARVDCLSGGRQGTLRPSQ